MSSPWSPYIANLSTCDNATFHATVVPLAEMVKLTYTATHGSYYNASEANATVAGWTRDLARTADPPAGMRALLFVQPSTRRGVVAFRGTDLNRSGVSGQADACADALLSGGNASLPTFCAQFSNHTLDYIARAGEFAVAAAAAYPTLELLFTGHSLGASLAMMATAMVQAGKHGAGESLVQPPALAFATGSWRGALRRRTGLAPDGTGAAARLWALADAWDPVQASARAEGELLGSACLWKAGVAPAGCEACWREGGGSAPPADWPQRPVCLECFEKAHIYSNYLYHRVPGPRPDCGPVGGGASRVV